MACKSSREASFSACFLAEVQEIAGRLDVSALETMAATLAQVRERAGRLFILGVGGGAGNASHAASDFRKLAGIEAYAPTDNISELTARVNDEGWRTVFVDWLRVSHMQARDAVMILSVGGGSLQPEISSNLVLALDYAKSVGAMILGVVGRDGGYTAKLADLCVLIPSATPERITPHTEAFQAVVWHLLVTHPRLQQTSAKWESVATRKPRSAVFLDRDGVLNEIVLRNGKPYPPATAAELRIKPGAREALDRLKARNFLLLVVTNQPDVARGTQRRDAIEDMERQLRENLPLDDVLTCYHDDADACDCRKPRPGLLQRAAQLYGIELRSSYLVGDRWRDIDAGANAGCKTVWIDNDYAERGPSVPADARVHSLPEAVDWILARTDESA